MTGLTKRSIDALKSARRRDTFLWDGETPGLFNTMSTATPR